MMEFLDCKYQPLGFEGSKLFSFAYFSKNFLLCSTLKNTIKILEKQ